jgi:hypothetical protein
MLKKKTLVFGCWENWGKFESLLLGAVRERGERERERESEDRRRQCGVLTDTD